MATPFEYKNINHLLLSLYLVKTGWMKTKTNHAGIDAYLEPNEGNKIEILLPNKDSSSGYLNRIAEAIKLISLVENRNEALVLKSVLYLESDLHDYKIPTPSSPDAVSMVLMKKLLESHIDSIKEAARDEHGLYYYHLSNSEKGKLKSPREEAENLINDCKFTHTWRGSFGISIEVPLQLPSIGMSVDIPETLGRKATRRILTGYKIINDAISHNSVDYIIDNIKRKEDITIFSEMPSLQEYVKTEEIEFSVNFSPSILVDSAIRAIRTQKITRTSLKYIERAVEQLRFGEDEIDIEIVGFPESFSASKQDLMKNAMEAERKVTVKGISRQIEQASVSLKMELSLDDYKKAIRAHEEVKSVSAKCRVKKKLRGWDVLTVYRFDLLS